MWLFSSGLQSLLLAHAAASVVPTYDYIIIGGGTSGLTLATRLTENPNISVLVLEAGNDHTNDTNILSPGLFTATYGDPEYDWNFKTVPQVHANGQVVAHPRGKQLGGSSAINFLYWTHPSRGDIDNWGKLGNANWSWEVLDPYFSKSEEFVQPQKLVEADLETGYIVPSEHGEDGPILNTFPDIYGPLDEAWPKAFDTLGLEVKSDPRDGLALGGYTNLLNLNLDGRKRIYAANGYWLPVKTRSNLMVVTGALVGKILFEDGDGDLRATGVQYSAHNETLTASATKEVILCAGSFGSPHILELSGIGNSTLLKSHGIKVVVANANVGENLQDHAYIPIGWEVIPGIQTLDNFTDPAYFDAAYEEYITNATGPLATTGASSSLLSCSQIGCGDVKPPTDFSGVNRPGLKEQYELLSDQFQTEAVTQYLTVAGGESPQFVNDTTKLFAASTPGNFFSLLGVLEHPYSRGYVHIVSADPTVYPEIDPMYFSHPFDLEVIKRIALGLNKIATTPPLSNLLKGNGTVYQPGYYQLNESNVERWVKGFFQSEYHPVGTCAMLPIDKGGVVDERFKVYGTSNLRVIDASIFPLQVRANLQTVVYAVAERGAEFIKEDASQCE